LTIGASLNETRPDLEPPLTASKTFIQSTSTSTVSGATIHDLPVGDAQVILSSSSITDAKSRRLRSTWETVIRQVANTTSLSTPERWNLDAFPTPERWRDPEQALPDNAGIFSTSAATC
jgi:hypothetical protein